MSSAHCPTGKQKPHEEIAEGVCEVEEKILEIEKQPGRSVGFYIREGNGSHQTSGIFVSRLASGSCPLLPGDEILGVNGVRISHTHIDDVVVLMSIPTLLKLHIRRKHQKRIKPLFILHPAATPGADEVEDEEEDDDEEEEERVALRPLQLQKLQLRQQAGDSNDSGLSSENSNSREQESQRTVHFAPDTELVQVYAPSISSESPTLQTQLELPHQFEWQLRQFRPCKSDRSGRSLHSGGVGGCLRLRLAGVSRLQDQHQEERSLFCEMRLDSERVARTSLRSGTDCIEWQEQFYILSLAAKDLEFLLHQWSSGSSSLSCHGSVNLVTLLNSLQQRKLRAEHLALQLEPKGCLYFCAEFMHAGEFINRCSSQPVVNFHSAICACICELQARGLRQPGLYCVRAADEAVALARSCCLSSVQMQQRLAPMSADQVPDIHAVANLLSDFLREQREPLFTDSLLPLLADALHVAISGGASARGRLVMGILACLPAPNQDMLQMLLHHMKALLANSDVNLLTPRRLGCSLGPLLLYPSASAAARMESRLLDLNLMADIFSLVLELWLDAGDWSRASNGGMISNAAPSLSACSGNKGGASSVS